MNMNWVVCSHICTLQVSSSRLMKLEEGDRKFERHTFLPSKDLCIRLEGSKKGKSIAMRDRYGLD